MEFVMNLEKLIDTPNGITKKIQMNKFFSEYRYHNLNATILSFLHIREQLSIRKLNKLYFKEILNTEEYKLIIKFRQKLIKENKYDRFIVESVSNNADCLFKYILGYRKHFFSWKYIEENFEIFSDIVLVPLLYETMKKNNFNEDSLNFSNCNLGTRGSYILSLFLERHIQLFYSLKFENSSINLKFFNFNFLTKHNLTNLELGQVPLSESEIENICIYFKRNNLKLKELNLTECEITDQKLIKLSSSLKYLKNLESLTLSLGKFGNKALKMLFLCFKKCEELKSLNLSNNNQFLADSHELICSFFASYPLISLNVSNTNINNNHIKDYSDTLSENPSIQRLYLCHNYKIKSEGFTYFGNSLKTNNKLLFLSLSGNRLNFESFNNLYYKLLQTNIKTLVLSKIPEETIEKIKSEVNLNKKIKIIL